jgi:hypothetical protein
VEHPVVRLMRGTEDVVGGLREDYPVPFRHYADALAPYDRCYRLYKAIVRLLASDLVHEAALLTRPLIAESLLS